MFGISGVQASLDDTLVLDRDVVDAFRAALSDALRSPSGLDDATRIDTIRALERLVCVASAAQAQLAFELDASEREQRAASDVPRARHGCGIGHQIAQARRESPHRGQRHLGLAKAVLGELPATWRAWRDGRITEWTATLVARETACLSRDDRAAVDHAVGGDPDRLEAMGVRELVHELQAEACRIDPGAVVARRRRAEADRHVTLRPAPDTMTWLTALLPVKEGVATYAALAAAASAARAAGDPRGKGQVMADALVARVLEGGANEPGSPRVSLNVVMTDHDLFGCDDEPAHLDGFGPIPAELAREIVVGACDRKEQIWLRRLFSHPQTGELVAADSQARLFRGSLARFIRLRDRVCRTPWCDAPVRHVDHPTDSADSGPTSISNGQGLCEACNYAKQAPGWRARPSPNTDGHEVETTLPTGHHYRSRPPRFVATVRFTRFQVDYVLTG